MRNHKLQWFSILFFILVFSSQSASAGLFDNDEQNWRRIFGEIKKINARLVSLEMGKLKALASVQQELNGQIEDIKGLLPNLQGSVEQSQAEVSGYFKATNKKLADIEAQIKLEIIKSVNQQLNQIQGQIANQLNQQKVANDQFQSNLAGKFSDLKGGMAADMEKVARINQQNSQELAQLNRDTLDRVVAQMNTQKQSLDKANEIIKSELIPTIIKQNEDASLKLRTEMSQTSNAFIGQMSQARKENKDTLLAGLSSIEAKNQKLLEVLGKNLKDGETTRENIELLSKSLGATNENVIRTQNNIVQLKDGMVQQMDTLSKGQQNLAVQIGGDSKKIDQKVGIVFGNLKIADEKINKLAESLNSLQSHSNELANQNNEMHQSITQLVTHSGEVNQSLKSVGQALQTIQGGLANVDHVNEKLTTLIGILKSIAAEQGKFTEIITSQGEIKQSQSQIFKSQMELNQVQVKMSQAQAEMSKAQIQMGKNQGVINQAQLDEKQVREQMSQNQARIYKAQEEIRSAQTQILKAQEEIRNAQKQTLKAQTDVKKNLADLSRKANVNISRNDSIRKTLSTLGRKSSPTPPRKR